MKIVTAAALAILLSSGMAFAQESGTTGATGNQSGDQSDGARDATDYLSGPNIHKFYTDDTMNTLRPDADVKSTWESMTPEEQTNLRNACQGNKDSRWSTLCNSIGTM